MAATRVLKFGHGFTLEPAEYKHVELAYEWTDADADHSGRVDPRFWLEQDADRDSYLCSDHRGPVLFFKVIMRDRPLRTAELHMQFMPTIAQLDHERIRATLLAGCPWLEQLLMFAGVEEICFESDSRGLIAFCTKRLGFKASSGGVLRKRIIQPAIARA